MKARRVVASVAIVGFLAGCSVATGPQPQPQPGGSRQTTRQPSTQRPVPPQLAERLQRVMTPLVRATNNPRPLNQIKIGILDDPKINAASAGNGEFYVTRGLLEKASDRHLAGILAHELAHDDLNHVAKAQTLNTGLNIGMVILDQIVPGSGALTPIAGALISRKYSRTEEYAADRHGVTILTRAGMPADIMVDTLQWLQQTEGGSSGGFFATHPGTLERIEALKNGR